MPWKQKRPAKPKVHVINGFFVLMSILMFCYAVYTASVGDYGRGSWWLIWAFMILAVSTVHMKGAKK